MRRLLGNRMRVRNKSGERGYSLVELLVASAITGLVLASVAMVMGTHARSYRSGNSYVVARQNARLAMLMIQRDIRAAGSNVFFDQNPLGPIYCDLTKVDPGSGREYPFYSVGGSDTGQASPYAIRRGAPYAQEEIIRSPYPLSRTTTNLDGSLVNQKLRVDRLSGPVYETDPLVHTIGGGSTQTIALLSSIPTSERPTPDWTSGTLVLVLGDTENGNMGVVRKITGGGFPTYSVASDGTGYNDAFSVGLITANDIVAGARLVMEINRTVEYTLDTTAEVLKFQDMLYDVNPTDVMQGIQALRVFMPQGGGYVPFDPAARPSVVRIEVEGSLADGGSVAVSGLAELRNY